MSDRRKDMWKLLYSLVNRNETELNDVFNCVDDILCKEPSLIKPSAKETNNRFQDTFILWLVNKLVKSLKVEEGQDYEIHDKNLRVQRKLLNSCLINRGVLFESLLKAYILAIEQICEEYAKVDLMADQEDQKLQLNITAFTGEDQCLREIDQDFVFPVINIDIDDVNDYIQDLLQVLHHGLFVGYTFYPHIFENSLLTVLKALKECDFSSKLYCLQYLGRVFQKVSFLNQPLEQMYQLSLKALTMMWNYMPNWLNNNCLSAETLEDFIEESTLFLINIKHLQKELRDKDNIIMLSFQLMENIYEIQQWLRLQPQFNVTNLSRILKTLVEFIFLQYKDLNTGKINKNNNFKLILRMAMEYPFVLRCLPTYLLQNKDNQEIEEFLRFMELNVIKFFQLDAWNQAVFELANESLNCLKIWEHLYQNEQQQTLLQNSKDKEFNLKVLTTLQLPASYLKVQFDKLWPPLEQWCSKLNNSTRLTPHELDEIIIAAHLLQNQTINEQISQQLQTKLVEIVLKPTKNLNTLKLLNNDNTNLLITLELLTQMDQKLNENANMKIQMSLKTVGKQIFVAHKDQNNLILKFCHILKNFVAKQWLSSEFIQKELINPNLKNKEIYISLLKTLTCLNDSNKDIIIIKKFPFYNKICEKEGYLLWDSEIICLKCVNSLFSTAHVKEKLLKQQLAVLNVTNLNHYSTSSSSSSAQQILPISIKSLLLEELFIDPQLLFITNHLDYCQISSEECLNSMFSSSNITKLHLPIVSLIVAKYIENDGYFLKKLSKVLLQNVIESLKPNQSEQYQQIILEIISSCTQNGLLSEQWLFLFFKMTFFYLLHPESKVVHEAVLCGCEMCSLYNVQPIQLWNWYKRDALNLIVKLIIYVYLTNGVRMTRSLKAFTKMLGFSCVQEFICKYYRLLVTMILPYCVKEPLCKGLIISISKITRKPVTNLFVVSFLRIYTHIYLSEDLEIGNACIEFVGKCTGASLSKLMNTDVKQTVSEFLVYFNRSPTFVMQAFQCLLPNEVGSSTSTAVAQKSIKSPTHEFANFIADRFLGVITYFQTCLAEPNFEKPLKQETLYSLGQIMRLIGSNNVTQFRFKIIAMLSFVLTLNDRNLQNICLKIWNIFLHIVNTQELGPSLSRIVASLQPLMATNPEEINEIYDFLILKNDSLLGVFIPDLYFLEEIKEVKPNIRQYVARQTEMLNATEREEGVFEKLNFLYKQVCNENLQVRIYGLNYLRTFIAKYRAEINHMIMDTIPVDPLVEQIIDELIKGCRHDDRIMNLASAKCLGELGAIDPSYMSSNFSFMNSAEISLSIHTDDFAIMALTELCRAYQFQKDTKYVDNFSLAIQETLSIFGVSPKENKKLNVWNALPTRMQQVMEPLLTSCYTGSRRESKLTEHPLFESNHCRSYEDWSFAWACRLIEMVQTDETRHLLNSYKPSIKRDTNMLAIFFPYVLLHALQESPLEKKQQIYEEFMAVFNICTRDVGNQNEIDTSHSDYKEFKSTKYSADRTLTDLGTRVTTNNTDKFEAFETKTQTCTKLCSEQVDFLQRWLRDWQKLNMVNGKLTQTDDRFKYVNDFVVKFNKSLISKANYNSGEYARALLYLEEYIEEQPNERLQEQLSFLIEIHGKLMDSDSVEGAVYMKKSNLSLEEEILVNRLVDRPQETITCYEQLLSKEDHQINQDHIKGMIDCYLRMDTPETALLITDGLWQKLADQYTDDYFKECKSELLWRLGRYDELQELLEDSVVKCKTTNWNIQCAESFLLFRQPNEPANFLEQLDVIRTNVVSSMRSCSGVTDNSYTHSYDEAIRLHLLNEVENNKQLIQQVKEFINSESMEGQETTNAEKCLVQLQKFFVNWDARLEVLQPTARVLEPVLSFRRNLLLETQKILQQDITPGNIIQQKVSDKINHQLVKLWLRSIQMNRESGCLQQAQISIMKAEQYQPVTLFLEKAKLLWQKGDQTNCFKLLEENIKVLEMKCEGEIRRLDTSSRHLYAEAKFLQASFNAESMNICSELNLRYFKEVVTAVRTCEKYYVHYSQYVEKIYDSLSREQKETDKGCELLIDIMIYYAKSLKFGYANVYQSLPRLLSIWLDFTSQLSSMLEIDSTQTTKTANFQQTATKMNSIIDNCIKLLPTSIFYTAFSQLLSRLCHPSQSVYENLRNIFVKLLEHFPQQSLWMLLPFLKSCHTSRIKKSRSIVHDARLANASFTKLFNDFTMLAERLIELTNKEVTFDCTYELSTLVRQLPRLFEDPNFSKIMLPFEKYMQPAFPITSTAESMNFNLSMSTSPDAGRNSSVPSNPFPTSCVFISGINEEVVVLRSAAKPKKITIECSDGLSYNIMVKPKDDLRKDFRLMEFNGLVKRYLHQDSQARHRRLRIRTYAAIPFNEECGLVEWLPNLNSFRGICVSNYRMRGLGIPDRALRQFSLPKTDPIEKKLSVFKDVLLARHPPIFHEWFKQRFPSPHSWYQARSSYIKTVAVMSMVGYILGLGDRHGENILFDETNGDAVHVDFNCLFNQGESFAFPEIVPFRLTHNMVFAMGPLGVEGLFRKCCEITLRVLKDEKKTLMSVLRPFVYDLGSISRLKNKIPTTGSEIIDPKAITDVKRIEERLQGYVKRTLGNSNSMPLSTEGQVNFLINEATDVENLASMYIGWGSYI